MTGCRRTSRRSSTIIPAQSPAGMAGAMWDVEAAAVADMVRQRGDTVTTLTRGGRALAQGHRAGDRGVAQADERSPDRRRQAAGDRRARCSRSMEQEPEPPPRPSAQPAPEPNAREDAGRRAAVEPPKAERPAPAPPAAKPPPGRPAKKPIPLCDHVATGYRQAARSCGRSPYSPR